MEHFPTNIISPLTTYTYGYPTNMYSLTKALPDTRMKRPWSHGVLVDDAGAVGTYLPSNYIAEAKDITIVDAILDRIAEESGPGDFAPEKRGPTTEELIRRAALDRELTRLKAHKELMQQEGLTSRDIEALTSDEKARLLRKYGSPRVNKVIDELAQQRAASGASAAPVTTGRFRRTAEEIRLGLTEEQARGYRAGGGATGVTGGGGGRPPRHTAGGGAAAGGEATGADATAGESGNETAHSTRSTRSSHRAAGGTPGRN